MRCICHFFPVLNETIVAFPSFFQGKDKKKGIEKVCSSLSVASSLKPQRVLCLSLHELIMQARLFTH